MFNDRPAGKAPPVMLNVYGAVPPATSSVVVTTAPLLKDARRPAGSVNAGAPVSTTIIPDEYAALVPSGFIMFKE